MKAFGNFLLTTRTRAALSVAALTLLAIAFPPFSYILSGTPLALVTLRKGVTFGTQVALLSLALTLLATLALNMPPALPLAFLVSVWIPVLCCAEVLRKTQSQGMMVLCAGAAGLLFTASIYARLDELQNWWQDLFQRLQDYGLSQLDAAQLEQANQLVTSLLSALFASGFVLGLISALLLARWWQSALFNPGGFREEFHALRLPRALVFATMVGLLGLLLVPSFTSGAIRDAVILMLSLYLFQGLSVMHYYFYTRGIPRIGSIGLYGTFFVLPHFILLFVTCVGLVNACVGWTPARATDKTDHG